jgi:hypothetical protein
MVHGHKPEQNNWHTAMNPSEASGSWLPGMDSNHENEIQILVCYHYTTRQYIFRILIAFVPRHTARNT